MCQKQQFPRQRRGNWMFLQNRFNFPFSVTDKPSDLQALRLLEPQNGNAGL